MTDDRYPWRAPTVVVYKYGSANCTRVLGRSTHQRSKTSTTLQETRRRDEPRRSTDGGEDRRRREAAAMAPRSRARRRGGSGRASFAF
jgi:hypothetical protein